MYYLQNRYYNTEWERFINADAIAGSTGELLGHNVFAYCKNNPVNMSDTDGFRPQFDDEKLQRDYTKYKINERKKLLASQQKKSNISNNIKTSNLIGLDLTFEGCAYIIGSKATFELIFNEDKIGFALYWGAGPYEGVPGLSGTLGITNYNTSDYNKLYGVSWDSGISVSGALYSGGYNNILGNNNLVGNGVSFGFALGMPGPAFHSIPMRTIILEKMQYPGYPLIIPQQ